MPRAKKSISKATASKKNNSSKSKGKGVKDLKPGLETGINSPLGFLRSNLGVGNSKKNKPMLSNNQSKPRSISLYRKIAFSFIILTVLLLIVVFYFSFVRLTIVLIPNQERISGSFIVDIYDKDKTEPATLMEKAMAGVVGEIEIEETKTFSSSGVEVIGQEVIGKVTIINKYNKNQPLVATTRLLSSDNKLFRIKETVNVPVGGSVEVEVYADEPMANMAIGPTKFTIPGLWAGLQDKIYGESKEKFIYREQTKKYIEQSDIDNGIKELKKSLIARAEKEIGDSYGGYNQVIYSLDENTVSAKADSKVGEEKDSFSITMKTTVMIVAFGDEQISNMVQNEFSSIVPDGKELMDFNKDEIVYALSSCNFDQGLATVKASFEGKMILKEEAEIIDRKKLVGLNRDQLEEYLSSFKEIASYEINFSPSFIDKVPNLVDRIKIRVEK